MLNEQARLHARGVIDAQQLAAGSTELRPGAGAGGAYAVLLVWDNVLSGPMQVHGANLAAAFPDVTVDNKTSGHGASPPSVPEPQVTVTLELVPACQSTREGSLWAAFRS